MIRLPRRARPIALLLLLAPTAAHAAAGFAFLEIPTGARAAALGGAYTSLTRGADAIFWNPAGLDGLRGVEVAGGHDEMFEQLRHDHFAVAGRVLGGGLAASVRALYSEPIEERNEIGELVGTFGAHDLEFALGYGRAVTSEFSAGLSVQAVRERIANLSATTYAFGAGAAWEPEIVSGLRLSATASHLGPDARYTIDGVEGGPVSLPAEMQAGASYGVPLASGFELRGAFEERLTRGRPGATALGLEIANAEGAAVRAGWRGGDTAVNFSVGAGYGIGSLRLDYAFVPLRLDLGDTHRFSFGARF